MLHLGVRQAAHINVVCSLVVKLGLFREQFSVFEVPGALVGGLEILGLLSLVLQGLTDRLDVAYVGVPGLPRSRIVNLNRVSRRKTETYLSQQFGGEDVVKGHVQAN